jgi:hypothetical protein
LLHENICRFIFDPIYLNIPLLYNTKSYVNIPLIYNTKRYINIPLIYNKKNYMNILLVYNTEFYEYSATKKCKELYEYSNVIFVQYKVIQIFYGYIIQRIQSRRPRGLRPGFAAACLLGSLVRIPPTPWMSVPCECCVLSGRSLYDEPVASAEKPNRVCRCATECSEVQQYNT